MSRAVQLARRFGALRTLDSVRLYVAGLAREVYGERAEWSNSSLTAFAYMYRRFGPPPLGTDGYKSLAAAWLLRTRDPDVYLEIDPGGAPIYCYLRLYVSERLGNEAWKPGVEWREECRRRYFAAYPDASEEDYQFASIDVGEKPWRDGMAPYPRCPPEIADRAADALRHCLGDLLRPVFVRDVPINLFGSIGKNNSSRGRVAPRHRLAGWGVPVREMEKLIRRRNEGRTSEDRT